MNNFSINIKKTFVKNICVSSHMKNVLSKYRSDQVPDIVILSEDESKRISAHRGILIAANEYLCNMFTIDMAEKNKKEVTIYDVNGEVLEMLIDYCYSGEVSVTNENVWDLLAAADMLQFTDVKTECASLLITLLEENPIECLRFYSCAVRYAFKDLINLAIKIAADLFNDIIKTDTFLDIPYEALKLILEKNESIESKEECIFNAAWAWVNHDEVNRKKYIPDILELVYLKDMNVDFLTKEIKPVCFLNNCHELVFNAVLSKAKPGTNTTFPKNSYILLAVGSVTSNDAQNTTNQNHILKLVHYSDGMNGLKTFKQIPIKFSPSDASFLTFNTNLYIFGESLLKIDLKTLKIFGLADMKTKRKCYSVATLNGLVYAIGGSKDSNDLRMVERYNPYRGTWSFVGEMSIARSATKIAVLSNYIYVIGGRADEEYIKSCEYYNPVEDKWTTIADMIEEKKNPNVSVLNDLIYVIGGDLHPSEYSNILVQIYNSTIDEWSKIFTVSAHTQLFTTAVFENEIVKISKKDESDESDGEETISEAVLDKFKVEENIWSQKICFENNCEYLYAAPVLTKFLPN